MIMLGVKVTPDMKEKLKAQGSAAGYGDDLSAYIRTIYAAALEENPTSKMLKAILAEAMVVILACQGRSVSTEQSIKLVKTLFLAGSFKEDLQ